MQAVAGIVVVAFGIALITLAAFLFLARVRAERFLRGFASSAFTHVLEQAVRLLAGAALVAYAPSMRAPRAFRVLGWLLVGSSAVLLLLPWRWHQRFGEWAIPLAIRYMRLYALGALALGAAVLYGALPLEG